MPTAIEAADASSRRRVPETTRIARDHDRDRDRGAEVGLDEDQGDMRRRSRRRSASQAHRACAARACARAGPRPRERARASPAPRAGSSTNPIGIQRRAPLTAVPDDEHGDEQRRTRREQERPRRVAKAMEVDAREDDERDETHQRVDRLALQVVGRSVGREQGPRRARAVDHDEPEGDEPKRDEDEQVVLELRPGRPLHSASTSSRKRSPRSSKSRNWS